MVLQAPKGTNHQSSQDISIVTTYIFKNHSSSIIHRRSGTGDQTPAINRSIRSPIFDHRPPSMKHRRSSSISSPSHCEKLGNYCFISTLLLCHVPVYSKYTAICYSIIHILDHHPSTNHRRSSSIVDHAHRRSSSMVDQATATSDRSRSSSVRSSPPADRPAFGRPTSRTHSPGIVANRCKSL